MTFRFQIKNSPINGYVTAENEQEAINVLMAIHLGPVSSEDTGEKNEAGEAIMRVVACEILLFDNEKVPDFPISNITLEGVDPNSGQLAVQ